MDPEHKSTPQLKTHSSAGFRLRGRRIRVMGRGKHSLSTRVHDLLKVVCGGWSVGYMVQVGQQKELSTSSTTVKPSSRIEQRDTVHTRPKSNLSKRFRFRNSLASLSVLVIRTSPTAPRVRLRPGSFLKDKVVRSVGRHSMRLHLRSRFKTTGSGFDSSREPRPSLLGARPF